MYRYVQFKFDIERQGLFFCFHKKNTLSLNAGHFWSSNESNIQYTVYLIEDHGLLKLFWKASRAKQPVLFEYLSCIISDIILFWLRTGIFDVRKILTI